MPENEQKKKKTEKTQHRKDAASASHTTKARKAVTQERHKRQVARKQRRLAAYIAKRSQALPVGKECPTGRTLGRVRKHLCRVLNVEVEAKRQSRRAARNERRQAKQQGESTREAYLGADHAVTGE